MNRSTRRVARSIAALTGCNGSPAIWRSRLAASARAVMLMTPEILASFREFSVSLSDTLDSSGHRFPVSDDEDEPMCSGGDREGETGISARVGPAALREVYSERDQMPDRGKVSGRPHP